jgi:hypothetical protein
VTTANPDDESRDRVTAILISSVPELDDRAARDVLAAAGAGHGRVLREMDSLLKEHPGALVTTPASYPLALVRLAHALIEAGYLTVAAPACAGCGKITADLRRKTASGPGLRHLRGPRQQGNVCSLRPGQADLRPASRGRYLLGLL